jgi:hypothetical protein
MMDASRPGPALDTEAAQAIVQEDDRHRQRLLEIEKEDVARWSDLLAEENDLHLKRLKAVYADLAERRLPDGGSKAGGTMRVEYQ